MRRRHGDARGRASEEDGARGTSQRLEGGVGTRKQANLLQMSSTDSSHGLSGFKSMRTIRSSELVELVPVQTSSRLLSL